jgi:hypothetical protein
VAKKLPAFPVAGGRINGLQKGGKFVKLTQAEQRFTAEHAETAEKRI